MNGSNIKALTCCLLLMQLAGCQWVERDEIDRETGLSRKEFKDGLLSPESSRAKGKTSLHSDESVETAPSKGKVSTMPPPLAAIVIPPKPPLMNQDKLITLSVTEDVSLRDVLMELARRADVDMQIDKHIRSGIILRVKDRPFREVIEHISEMAGLRYSMVNNILKVELDSPYVEQYNLDLLNSTRSTTASVNISTNVGGSGASSASGTSGSSGGGSSSGGESGGASASSGSKSSISLKTDGDTWKAIEVDLRNIVNGSSSAVNSNQPANNALTAAGQSPNATSNDQPSEELPFVVINRQAGIITVRANGRHHAQVKAYLAKVRQNMAAQVLIEAKVLEVTLNDQFRTGINWDLVDNKLGIGFRGNFVENTAGISEKISLGVFNKVGRETLDRLGDSNGDTLHALADLTQLFGTTRTLSSPRLHAMNNQQAVLSFAENQVYFTLQIQQTSDQLSGTTVIPGQTTVNSTLNTVPIGLLLTLQPSINSSTNEITMNIRPTLSRVTKFVADPAVTFLTASSNDDAVRSLKSEVPVVEVREMDSVLKLKSGQVMVIGGLMEERAVNKDNGIPVLGGLPVIGRLFKSVGRETTLVQTVIFIRATVISSDGLVPSSDQRFYEQYSRDPQPLRF
jgi:MSHA type pilus biogenesis protein MshL